MSGERLEQPRFELWRRVEPDRDFGYQWMVWEVGPTTGAEEWFESEEAARDFIASRRAAQEGKA